VDYIRGSRQVDPGAGWSLSVWVFDEGDEEDGELRGAFAFGGLAVAEKGLGNGRTGRSHSN
jgi:hypothetical protein